MKKSYVLWGVAAVLILGAAFYAGVLQSTGGCERTSVNNFERAQRFPGAGAGMLPPGGPGGQINRNGGNVNGEIISKDDASITVKLRDGGSKIIFLSGSTTVTKTTEGTLKDLKIGEQVMVRGTQNSDGSVTAENVQTGAQFPRLNDRSGLPPGSSTPPTAQ